MPMYKVVQKGKNTMMKQSKLLECMEEIKAIAHAQQGQLTKDEIKKYLSDMELEEKQLEAVYQYLAANHIKIEGYDYIPPVLSSVSQEEKAEGERKGDSERETAPQPLTKAQRNLKIYQTEVSALQGYTALQEAELFQRFLQGEASLRNEILQGKLDLVMNIARDYNRKNVLLEDVIAEGNIGLLNAMSVFEEEGKSFLKADNSPDMERIHSVIEMEIRHAMESMIDDCTEQKDWEDTMLAKINLLHEAAKYLAEDLGRSASLQELAEYTKLSEEEIQELSELSQDAKKVIG